MKIARCISIILATMLFTSCFTFSVISLDEPKTDSITQSIIYLNGRIHIGVIGESLGVTLENTETFAKITFRLENDANKYFQWAVVPPGRYRILGWVWLGIFNYTIQENGFQNNAPVFSVGPGEAMYIGEWLGTVKVGSISSNFITKYSRMDGVFNNFEASRTMFQARIPDPRWVHRSIFESNTGIFRNID